MEPDSLLWRPPEGNSQKEKKSYSFKLGTMLYSTFNIQWKAFASSVQEIQWDFNT